MIKASSVVLVLALAACGGSTDSTQPKPVASVVITSPSGSVSFGAFGSTRQFAAQAKDASGGVVTGAAIAWSSSDSTVAAVSASGLVTAVRNGSAQISASSSGFTSAPAPVTVAQVTASVAVASGSATPDTLFATGRTKQFSATARDSTGNALATQPAFAWTSSATAVATVDAGTGLATAVADGSAGIRASVGGVLGSRTLVVRRIASTHSLTPTSDSITTNGGTAGFAGSASDSSGAALTVLWASRDTGTLTVSPASGDSTTATGTGNGTTRVVMSVAAGPVDSASVVVKNQVSTSPDAASVTVGDIFFQSAHNNSKNPAVDTVAVGGTVTWTWGGAALHSVQSTGSPSFTSSAIQSTGFYSFTFNTAGTYTYNCAVHGAAMTGTVVVR